MKKKVAIITFEFNYNYGAILQTTALKNFLNAQGYEVDIVNRGWGKLPPPISHLADYKQIISNVVGSLYTLRSIRRFKKKYWKLTKQLKSEKEIEVCLEKYDVIVIGSDQIWNSACIETQGLYYFGIHTNPKVQKVIAYAPSFGHDYFESSTEVIERISKHLKLFRALSIRENEGSKILKNLFKINDVTCVLDPTMLMTKDFYNKLANKKSSRGKTLAFYILDMTPEKKTIIETFAQEHGLQLVNMNRPERIDTKNLFVRLKSLKYPSIESWLQKIINAEFVITDSYHGTVFSILFNKQFLTFGNPNRGMSRFNTLLSRFGLNEHLLTPEQYLSKAISIEDIDYSRVNAILNKERDKSSSFLIGALK